MRCTVLEREKQDYPVAKKAVRSSPVGVRSNLVAIRSSLVGLRSSFVGVRSSLVAVRSNSEAVRSNPVGVRSNLVGIFLSSDALFYWSEKELHAFYFNPVRVLNPDRVFKGVVIRLCKLKKGITVSFYLH